MPSVLKATRRVSVAADAIFCMLNRCLGHANRWVGRGHGPGGPTLVSTAEVHIDHLLDAYRPALRAIEAITDCAMSCWHSRILSAAIATDLFPTLSRGPHSCSQLALALRCDHVIALRLLDAAAALGLLVKRSDGLYENAPFLNALAGSDDFRHGSGAWCAHWDTVDHTISESPLPPLRHLRQPYHSCDAKRAASTSPTAHAKVPPGLRHTAHEPHSRISGPLRLPDRVTPWLGRLRDHTRESSSTDWWDGMSFVARSSNGPIIADIINQLSARTLLDVGCGTGVYAELACRLNPDLRATLLDFPAVSPAAASLLDSNNQQFHSVVADIRELHLDTTFDVVLASNTLHMLPACEARQSLDCLCRHVRPGGFLIVQEWPLDESLITPRLSALFNLHISLAFSGDLIPSAALHNDLSERGLQILKSFSAGLYEVTLAQSSET